MGPQNERLGDGKFMGDVLGYARVRTAAKITESWMGWGGCGGLTQVGGIPGRVERG
jgi:hypothetical protein